MQKSAPGCIIIVFWTNKSIVFILLYRNLFYGRHTLQLPAKCAEHTQGNRFPGFACSITRLYLLVNNIYKIFKKQFLIIYNIYSCLYLKSMWIPSLNWNKCKKFTVIICCWIDCIIGEYKLILLLRLCKWNGICRFDENYWKKMKLFLNFAWHRQKRGVL